jgi:hypothetical protein
MNDTEACRYRLPWSQVEKRVRPFRATNSDRRRRELWWQFTRPTLRLYEAIADLERVLVIAQTSRTQMPTLVPKGQVFDQKLVVFPTSATSDLAFRASAFQYWWTVRQSSTMKNDTVYAPSDCCETLPCPEKTSRMTSVGADLDTSRRSAMERREVGLTKLYDLMSDVCANAADIVRLQEIHVEIDEAVREAYAQDEDCHPAIRAFEAKIASAPLPSWREIDLAHGFHDTPQGTRFTISPQARIDVLDKLLALNHYRHQQELASGLPNQRKPKKASPKPRPATQGAATLDDGTLFPPPDTLF